ncbi:hypothetical protein [Streptomyces sp. NPDC004528]|uniref:hypothetical protein n=1 Tax=Streptomyces sp. NPDC004528 TaxID=3154550 RepID=UPI0033A59D14
MDITGDRRFSIALEWCGYSTRRWVARFCGRWIGQQETEAEARAMATSWNRDRMGV